METPDIISLEKLMVKENYPLAIPVYQRPYVWHEKSINMLFSDIYQAFKKGQKEYRLGTIILHKSNENKQDENDKDIKNNENQDKDIYHIVDGQQRSITLALLLYILGDTSDFLLDSNLNKMSKMNIQRNYNILKTKVEANLKSNEKQEYLKYMKENCTFAVIITNEEEEAFQFFDSQNSRGKSLAPHDYLKAYHLRQMQNISEVEKEYLINQWESIDDKSLIELFSDYLYPIIKWHKGKNGLYYNKEKIDVFKGISEKSSYNFALYHINSHIFAENIKKASIPYLFDLNQFQLTQPVIAGERFFKYVLHYYNLLKEVKEKVDRYNKNEEVPYYKTGDIYIKQLYISALLFFVDRFNIKSLEEKHMDVIYKWSYALRLVMYSVYRESVDKYARDKHDRLNDHNSLFVKINSITLPDEILNITLMNIKSNDKYEYKDVYKNQSDKYPMIVAKYENRDLESLNE